MAPATMAADAQAETTQTPLRTCRVLLLKGADDVYAAAFQQQQHLDTVAFEPHFVDVLTFEYVNAQALHTALTHLERYSALLITSPRGATAVANTMQALQHIDAAAYAQVLATLRALRIFSVGRATSRELDVLGVTCLGDDCGSADALTAYLQQDGVLPAESRVKPVLFACGEKHSDVLPSSFRARGVALEELVVYRSCAVTEIELPPGCAPPHWVAFFSPSGLKAVKHVALPWTTVRKAAIGNTTAAALRSYAIETEQSHWEADAVAAAPTADALARAICSYEASAAPQS